MTAPIPPVVTLTGITRRFPGVTAAADVSLSLLPGEVHVLLGENGAGKSTLVALLAGQLQPDAGAIAVDGRTEALASPARSLALGIATVFQHPVLVPTLSVADNLALGGGRWWRRPDRAGLAARFATAGRAIGVAVDPAAIVGALSAGERQQVEIVRALLRGSRVLVLDEPTAMLAPEGAAELGRLMRRLAARGLAVVFITHKLAEALAFGDHVTVLRRGRVAGALGPAELAGLARADAEAAILDRMFGTGHRPAGASDTARAGTAAGAPTLILRDLAVDDPVRPVADVSLAVRPGEILAVAGLDGSGQRQLAEAVAGQRPAAAGAILLDGLRVETLGVAARRRLGLRYVSDDRLGEGTVGSLAVSLNLLLKDIGAPPCWLGGLERRLAVAAHARRLVAAFDVRTPDVATRVGALSGGNVQKVVLARELEGGARAVVYAKPTHGLDVRAAEATRRRIRAAAQAGVATLLISTDLDEVLELADRIAVMAGGRLVGTIRNDGAARQRVGAIMSAGAGA